MQRGRDLFGSGANYGKAANDVGAPNFPAPPVWRAGANVTTRLKTEVPLVLGSKTVPAGGYSLFIDLVKPTEWTLIDSGWPAQTKFDPKDKAALWGAYGYTPDKDVARVPMKVETLPSAVDQLTWTFLDMTKAGGRIALMWGKTRERAIQSRIVRPAAVRHYRMAGRFAFRVLIPALALLASAGASQGPDTSTKAIVEAAAGYVADYQRQLTSVIADEIYTQEVVAQSPRDPQMPRLRTMRSEVFFVYLATSHHWMAIRDVMSLDGNALGDRPDLRDAFQRLAVGDVAARFKEYNSQYNLGRTFRNFNEPTLSLLVFDERHRARFSFDRKRVERQGDTIS